MTGRKDDLLTVEVAQAWLRVTEAERQKEEERMRALIVDRVLNAVLTRASCGCPVQLAADEVWQNRGLHAPTDVRQIVSDTLVAIGWTRRTGEAGSD